MMDVLEGAKLWRCPDTRWHRIGLADRRDQAWTVCGRWLLAWWKAPLPVFFPYPITFGFLVPTPLRCVNCERATL